MRTIIDESITVTFEDGSVWAIPVRIIAHDRAKNYKREFNNSLHDSLVEDTRPLFESDVNEIFDWAKNNMDWADVANHATPVKQNPANYADEWCNSEMSVIYVWWRW